LLNRALIVCLCIVAGLSSTVRSTYGGPYKLLVNGSFVNGLRGWTSEGLVYLEQGYGSISQTIERQDLSLFLELSYEVCTVFRIVGSPTSYARSIITYHVADAQGRVEEFTVVGKRHEELGGGFPNFQSVRIDLRELFHKSIGLDQTYSLRKVKVALELGFHIFAPFVSSAYFKNVSLKRCNPAKLVVQQHHNELVDRTELFATVANSGDLDASNLIVRLDVSADLQVVSQPVIFQRSLLEGRSSWQVSWIVSARSSGSYPITIHAMADQAEAQLSALVPVRAPQPVTTQTTIQTVTSIQAVTTRVMTLSIELLVLIVLAVGVIVAVVVYTYSNQRKRRS